MMNIMEHVNEMHVLRLKKKTTKLTLVSHSGSYGVLHDGLASGSK